MKLSETEIYRIVDANLNRAREGFRVVEEFARFVLDHKDLQRKTKSLRHKLASLFVSVPLKSAAKALTSEAAPRLEREMLIDRGRDAQSDVGKDVLTPGEAKRARGVDVLQANFARIEESVRVLEEFTKFCPRDLPAQLKALRFEVYTLEKEYVRAACRAEHADALRAVGLYPIIDREAIENLDPVKVARQVLVPGVRIVQYRDKISSTAEICEVCIELRKLTRKKEVIFIVNDRVDVAQAVAADGVHLGQDDMPVPLARRLLGSRHLIGKSTHSFAQACRAAKEEVDYIAVGPIFSTQTKPGARAVGLELIARVRTITDKPIIAIGGINNNNIREVLDRKADGAAVISAILTPKNIRSAAVSLVNVCRKSMKRAG